MAGDQDAFVPFDAEVAVVPETEEVTGTRRNWARTFLLTCVLLGVSILVTIYCLWPLYKLGCVDSAIYTLRTVVTAEKEFAQAHRDHGYACALQDLDAMRSERWPGGRRRNGYEFELSCSAKNTTGIALGFRIIAPLHSKMPAYCSDQSGVLRYDQDGSPEKCLQSGVPL